MSASHPDAADLFQVLREHLSREVSPLLPPEQQFRLRIADRLLEILAREQAQGAAADGGATGTLRAELAQRIRDEGIATDTPELLAHLRATLADRLGIDNPRWLPPEAGPTGAT
jgi:hypothetical protein